MGFPERQGRNILLAFVGFLSKLLSSRNYDVFRQLFDILSEPLGVDYF